MAGLVDPSPPSLHRLASRHRGADQQQRDADEIRADRILTSVKYGNAGPLVAGSQVFGFARHLGNFVNEVLI